MQSRKLLMGGAAVLATAAALATVLASRGLNLRHGARVAPGTAHLVAFTGRSAAQRGSPDSAGMDAALSDLARHAGRARPGHVIEDLHVLNPAARFRRGDADGHPAVLIDAVTRGDTPRLQAALVSLGLEHPSAFSNDVSGWLPVSRIADATKLPEVTAIHAAMSRARAGSPIVATQGDFVQRSFAVRAANPLLTGAGVTVGVLSDSFDCYAIYEQPGSTVPVSGYQGYAFNGFTADAELDEGGGALPASVNVLAEPGTNQPTARGNCDNYGAPDQAPFTDEGRAMLQVVHAVAPGANLMFYTGDDGEASFANGILALQSAGAKIIADDLGYFDEPFYQDGLVAQAVNSVKASGAAYFSAAGNNANSSWESTAPSFATQATSGSQAGELLVNFDTSGASTATSLPINVQPLFPGQFMGVIIEWDQPYVTGSPGSAGASSHIDVCVTGATGDYLIFDNDNQLVTCTGPNKSGVDPVQVLIIGNPANATANTPAQMLNIVVGLADGTPAPGRLIVSVQTDGQTNPPPISTYATNSASLQGHPGAAGAAAVGAAFYYQSPQCAVTPALLEPYSAEGGAPVLFDTSGNRLATPIVRQKPDFVAPDGINNTFLGFQLAGNDINGISVGSNGQLPTGIAACQNNASYPNFFGTSAATPHAAGIAALMLQANSAATPDEIYQALRLSALPMTGSGPTPNFLSGYGFVQADTAMVVPVLTLSANSIPLGGSSTLSWTTIAATSCTASGAWGGTQNPSGSLLLTPSVAGLTTYTLSCTNAAGAVAASSATLNTGGAPPAPGLSISTLSIPLGSTATLTWSDIYATACTASGGWSGTLPPTGTQAVAPGVAGEQTYLLQCSNTQGSSPVAQVSLDVTAAPVPDAPTLALAASSITLGQSTTLTWGSVNATSCTASGSWSGPESTGGNMTLTPTATGVDTYTLICSNASGASQPSTVTLTVSAANTTGSSSGGSGGGGGGSLDLLSLGFLAGLGLIKRKQQKGT